MSFLLGQLSSWLSQWAPVLGLVGSCLYIVGFAVPFERDVPLLILAAFGVLAALFNSYFNVLSALPLIAPVCGFLLATALATLGSENIARSVRLSAPLLPALLLFFLIATQRKGTQGLRLLYLAFTVVAFELACAVLWIVTSSGETGPSAWVLAVGSPILLVPNDITFLAIVAPLSLVLCYQEPFGVVGVFAALSLFVSLSVICLLQSRAGMLTMVVSLGYCAALVFPQRRLTWGLAICFLALAIDGVLGFPLLAKFGRIEEGRIAMWLAAWAMFCDAPILGHGPHTFVLLYKLYLQRLSLPAWLPVDTRVVPWAHNLYFEILAEQGIVGLAAFGFLLVRGLGAAWRLQRAPPTERRIFAAGALAGLCGFCLAAAVELSLLRQWAVIVFFSLLGVIAQLLSSYSPEPVLEKEE